MFSKLVILSLQAKVLSMLRYPYASNGVRLYLETQKRLGKSGIRTHDQQKTEFYIVKCAIFNVNFLNTTWDYVDGTKPQNRFEVCTLRLKRSLYRPTSPKGMICP